jgi:hypothetical protein
VGVVEGERKLVHDGREPAPADAGRDLVAVAPPLRAPVDPGALEARIVDVGVLPKLVEDRQLLRGRGTFSQYASITSRSLLPLIRAKLVKLAGPSLGGEGSVSRRARAATCGPRSDTRSTSAAGAAASPG